MEDSYNLLLRRDLTIWAAPLLPALHLTLRLLRRPQIAVLKQYWAQSKPGLVISVVPHFNSVLAESLASVCPNTPFVVLMADLADFPPHFWIEKQQQWLICATPFARAQAMKLGLPADHIFTTTGLLMPRFDAGEHEVHRADFGFKEDIPLALVQAGAEGSQVMTKLATWIRTSDVRCQFLFMTGASESTYRGISESHDARIAVMKLTDNFVSYLRMADYVIGKPGSVTVSQAAALRKPMLVCGGRSTLPHERYNVEWIVQNGFGRVVPKWDDLGAGLKLMLDATVRDQLRGNLIHYENHAFVEVPQLLDRVMSTSAP
jgi:hypothetical protein